MRYNPEILSIQVLCKQPGRYIGWPTITRAANGDLLVVFSGDRDAHVCMEGKTQMIRSKDNGKTWSEPVMINNTPVDDRDAGIITLQDRTLVLSWFTSAAAIDWHLSSEHEDITEQDMEKWLGGHRPDNRDRWESGHWIRRSTDHGYTWEEPVRVVASAPHGPIELSDGSLLFLGSGTYRGQRCIAAEKSYDQGKSWTVESIIPSYSVDENRGRLCEPHAVEVEENKILGMFRYERTLEPGEKKVDSPHRDWCVLWQAESEDGGKTWNRPYPTEIWGKPPHLTKLKDGTILVSYGHRREPFGERACFSYDGGRTWDYENEVILSDPGMGDLGYPASLEIAEGTVMTVYYEKDDPEEKTCLKATTWKYI